jgi:hypothetical protein
MLLLFDLFSSLVEDSSRERRWDAGQLLRCFQVSLSEMIFLGKDISDLTEILIPLNLY